MQYVIVKLKLSYNIINTPWISASVISSMLENKAGPESRIAHVNEMWAWQSDNSTLLEYSRFVLFHSGKVHNRRRGQ